jgi:hypothetical protein
MAMAATNLQSKVLEVRGVDGYLSLDLEFELIENKLPQGINFTQFVDTVKQMLINQRALGLLESTVLLTEKGVLHINLIGNYYFVVLAGHKFSVDVAQLTQVIEEIKLRS